MKPFVLRIVVVTLLLLVASSGARAQGVYIQVDAPGSTFGTFLYGVNTNGDIAGSYTDDSFTSHGFLLSGGNYTIIDYPGDLGTVAYGLNDLGQVVGATARAPVSGFSYDFQAQTFTPVNFPAAIGTYPRAINNSGEIAGYAQGSRFQFGFTLRKSEYRGVVPKGAQNATVLGVSSSGRIVGYVVSPSQHYNNFATREGVISHLSIPGAPGAVVQGISPAGTAIVGYYSPSEGVNAGFAYQNHTLTPLQFPGANQTFASGINDLGEVVGIFYDHFGVHGFTWKSNSVAEAGSQSERAQ